MSHKSNTLKSPFYDQNSNTMKSSSANIICLEGCLWWNFFYSTLEKPEICMQVKKQQLELDMELQTCPKSGKEYVKAVYCHPVYLTYMQSTSKKNAKLDEV